MIGLLWSMVTGNPVTRALAKIGGLVLLAITFGAWNRHQGSQAERAKADSRALDAIVKGQEAARKGRAEAVEKLREGKTPEEIVRGNDAKW